MASTACFLHYHAFNFAPILSRSSSSQSLCPNNKPSKLVCRAENKPLSNGDQVQGGVSRRLVLDGLIVGTALAVSVGEAYADDGFTLEPSGKQSWPELVGEKGEVAVATIEKENPNVKAFMVPEGGVFDLKYDPSRVRVVVNKKGVVTVVPRVG
ncbi:hypothetical protein CRYUN_Cryun09bG0217900 [Craigia yunnanensis]